MKIVKYIVVAVVLVAILISAIVLYFTLKNKEDKLNLSLNENEITIEINSQYTITAEINANNAVFSYHLSSDFITVEQRENEFTITAKKVGRAVLLISALVNAKTYTETCIVNIENTVEEKVNTFTIKLTNLNNCEFDETSNTIKAQGDYIAFGVDIYKDNEICSETFDLVVLEGDLTINHEVGMYIVKVDSSGKIKLSIGEFDYEITVVRI